MKKTKQEIIDTLLNKELLSERAYWLMTYVFDGVTDKAGKTYEGHCMRVAAPFKHNAWELYACALLHDVVEDTDFTIENIENLFNPNIARTVDNLTKREGESYSKYTARLIKSGDTTAMQIKLSDLHDNMNMLRLDIRDLTKKDLDRLKKYQYTYEQVLIALMGLTQK